MTTFRISAGKADDDLSEMAFTYSNTSDYQEAHTCHTDLALDQFEMGRRARARQSAVVPQLPREVVQHIFSMRKRSNHDECSELVLSPRDRVSN